MKFKTTHYDIVSVHIDDANAYEPTRWYVKKCVKFQVAWSRLQGQ